MTRSRQRRCLILDSSTRAHRHGLEHASGRDVTLRFASLGDWRGAALARLRTVIRQADAGIAEEWTWRVPVWSCGGIICTGETYKAAVKLTFAHGAALDDPAGLFNASLDGAVRRAIDVREGVDAEALTALVRAAVAQNASRAGSTFS